MSAHSVRVSVYIVSLCVPLVVFNKQNGTLPPSLAFRAVLNPQLAQQGMAPVVGGTDVSPGASAHVMG